MVGTYWEYKILPERLIVNKIEGELRPKEPKPLGKITDISLEVGYVYHFYTVDKVNYYTKRKLYSGEIE
jgi:hypothetical protein